MALGIGAADPRHLHFCATLPIYFISNASSTIFCVLHSPETYRSRQRFSTDSIAGEFSGKNAYEILGVSPTSTSAEIKSSFRNLAKQTHPDLGPSRSSDATASRRFVQILAAYEILSDSERRAHYDNYLFTQKKVVQKQSRQGSTMNKYQVHVTKRRQLEGVEWLKWYRSAIHDILSQKEVITSSGYFDILENEFYSAVHKAYYGPVIESMDLLPDCFEAEERSAYDIPEVLHLVSGRDLFGIACLADSVPEISHASFEKLSHFKSIMSKTSRVLEREEVWTRQVQMRCDNASVSDAYKDLELHISGRLVAVATRIRPKNKCGRVENQDYQDSIHVFLTSHGDGMFATHPCTFKSALGSSNESRILLGTITGLGTNPEESSCFVYNSSGTKTHVIMKHRTLLVKHMHWYQVENEVSPCECRCSRARLPPSKFWLFEPRCSMHDVGGWYIETFGRDRKGKTVPSQRQWDGTDAFEPSEKRLHPAMYLLALAYRTLDIESSKRRMHTITEIFQPKLFRLFHWCKKLL